MASFDEIAPALEASKATHERVALMAAPNSGLRPLSLNDTYLVSPVHKDIYLHMDEFVLNGHGLIGLGR